MVFCCWYISIRISGLLNLFPDNKSLDWSRLKAFADNKLTVTQDIKVISHKIENIVGKEENAGYQHFLLFPQYFQKFFFLHCVKSRHRVLTHSHTMTPFDAPEKQAFWKHCGKRRNCSLWAISPFPTVFSTRLDNFLPFLSYLILSSANSFSLEESKICHLVMG